MSIVREPINKNWNKEDIYTVYGELQNGLLSTEEGIISAVTYGSFKEQYNGVIGFFNLRYSEDIGMWIIFQCLEA